MPAKNKQKEYAREIRFLHRAMIGLIIVILFLGYGLWRIPQQLVVYTAPDVSKTFIQKVGEVPPTSVYGFARTLWETINYCEKDCAEEYPNSLNHYVGYLTERCYLELKRHYDDNRSSAYAYRRRLLLPTENAMYSPDKIRQMSTDSWFVKLEYNMLDTVHGLETRNNIINYPIKVVRSSRPLSANPLGLEIDCFWGDGPTILQSTNETKEGK